MNRVRAWGFAVGVMIAWVIGFAVAATRFGEAHRRRSAFVVAPHSGAEPSRGYYFR